MNTAPAPISPRAFLFGAAVFIAVLAVPGALTVHRGGGGAFDLDGELTIPALGSAGLLLCATAAAALAARRDPRPGRRPWPALALLFAVMGVDEAAGLHEALEDATTTDWQTLYAPVVLLAGLAWLLAFERLSGRIERGAWLAAAGAWLTAQVLEALQWTGPREAERAVEGYGILMGFEELLEMAGSALFAFTLLAAVWRWGRAAAGPPSRAARATAYPPAVTREASNDSTMSDAAKRAHGEPPNVQIRSRA